MDEGDDVLVDVDVVDEHVQPVVPERLHSEDTGDAVVDPEEPIAD